MVFTSHASIEDLLSITRGRKRLTMEIFKHVMFAILGTVIALTVLVHAQSQSGFISIDCGLPENSGYTDEKTGIDYASDVNFIENGGVSIDLSKCSALKIIAPSTISRLVRLEEVYMPYKFNQWQVEGDDSRRSRVEGFVSSHHFTNMYSRCSICTKRLVLPKAPKAVENLFDWKEKVASTSDQETKMLDTPMPPFDGNVEDPKYLKNSELPKINFEMMCHNQLSSMFCFQNLKDLFISNCCNLKFLFSSSTLTSFVQLQCLMIRNCKAMEEIIRIDDLGNNIELLYLKKLSIEECPEMKAIIFGDKPTCGVGESSMDANDWRNQLTHNTRR
ncbi:hypothetical protein ACOSQ3_021664 [Xanthoceras sorbifolium]